MTENIRVCILNARKQKRKFCAYLNDDFDCTAPTYEYDYCIGFLKRLNGGFFKMNDEKRFQIIHLGNPYDFVVKDHQTNRTYGTFQGDEKSMEDMLNNLYKENQERVESRGSKGESTKDSLKFPNSVRLADSFKDLVDICDYSEPTDAVDKNELDELVDRYNRLKEENEQLKQFIQELTTKGTGKIHLANGSIYKVDTILINIKGDVE